MEESKLIEPIYHIDIAGNRYSLEGLESLEVIHYGSRVIAHVMHSGKNHDTLAQIAEKHTILAHVRSGHGTQTVVVDLGNIRFYISMNNQ